MKNKILYSLGVASLMLLQVSCTQDFLELTPKTGQVEANYYQTEKDAFFAMTAVYDALSVQNWAPVPIMSDIWSDDAYAGGSDAGDMRQWQEIEQNIMDAESSSASDLWARCYAGLYRANLYIQKEPGIKWETEGLRERYMAEVKFLRAYFFWDLVRHYGSVPIITEVLPSVEDYRSVKQHTPAEVYRQIATDLLAAIPNLPAQITSTEKGRISKQTAQALLARIFLFYEGFAKPVFGLTETWTDGSTQINKQYVQNALEEIINSGRYRLLGNYADVFNWANQNNDESLLEWQYSEKARSDDWGGWGINGNFSVIFYGIRNPVGDPGIDPGWSFATVSWSLANAYETGDPRKTATIYNAEEELTEYLKAFHNTGYFNRKFLPNSAYRATAGAREHNYPRNYMDIRYADVLLMAAELFLQDNPAKAAGYFNQVRTRAMGPAAAKSAITLDDIYRERRVEFGGEGHRKWDLLRRGLTYAGQQINQSFSNIPAGIPNAQDFIGRNFKPDTWGMFPIPASEIRNTNQGVLQQFVPAYK
jgi:starch-binding outer membrane protein, SusD/RagB family